MRTRLLCAALLFPFALAGCGDDPDGLDDDSIDWSEQCGTLLTIADDEDQTADYRAKALDRYSENC